MYSGATPEFIDGDVFKTKISLNEANRSDGGVNGGVSGGVSGGVKLSEINREVLECIKENGEFNAEKIAEKIKRGKRTVERAIKSLKEQGTCKRVADVYGGLGNKLYSGGEKRKYTNIYPNHKTYGYLKPEKWPNLWG